MQPKNEMETEELKLQKAFSGMSDEEIQDTKIMIITKDGLPFCVKIKDLPKWREKGLID